MSTYIRWIPCPNFQCTVQRPYIHGAEANVVGLSSPDGVPPAVFEDEGEIWPSQLTPERTHAFAQELVQQP